MTKSSLMPSKKEIATQVSEIVASLPNDLTPKQVANLTKWYTFVVARTARMLENAIDKA